MPHQVVVRHHLLDVVGQGEGHGQGQSRGSPGADPRMYVSNSKPWRETIISQTLIHKTKESDDLSYLGIELVDGEPDAEDDHGDEGHGHAAIPDLDGEVGQLGLQNTLLLIIISAPATASLARTLGAVTGGVGQGVVRMGVTHSLLHINWNREELEIIIRQLELQNVYFQSLHRYSSTLQKSISSDV